MVFNQTDQPLANGRTENLAVPKPSDQELLKKDFLPQNTEALSGTTTSTPQTSPGNNSDSSHHLMMNSYTRSGSSQSSFKNPLWISQNIVTVTSKSHSNKIMEPVCSDEIDGIINRIKKEIGPLLDRCEEQERKINRLKESLHPHILSTRTAVSHLNYLASRATKTAELIEEKSKTFSRLAKEDIKKQTELDSIGHEQDSSNTQSDLLGGDHLELARTKLLSLNARLEKQIALQRHYETKLAKYLSKIRRLFLVLLSVKILVDLKHRNQFVHQAYDFFSIKLINTQRLSKFIFKSKDQSGFPAPSQAHQSPTTSPMDDHQNEPVFSFLIHLLWLFLLKIEFF